MYLLFLDDKNNNANFSITSVDICDEFFWCTVFVPIHREQQQHGQLMVSHGAIDISV